MAVEAGAQGAHRRHVAFVSSNCERIKFVVCDLDESVRQDGGNIERREEDDCVPLGNVLDIGDPSERKLFRRIVPILSEERASHSEFTGMLAADDADI